MGEVLYSGKVVFSREIDDLLRDLERETQKIDGDDYSEEELIDMAQMEVIRKKAARALELILQSDGSESTVEIIE